MCGITGFFEINKNNTRDKAKLVSVMTTSLEHRGPDDSAFYNSEYCSLGMRRLAILDLQPGLYPFSNEQGNLHLVFNGEIYNFKIIRTELIKLGYNFKTNCDGEVILKGYEEWGVKIFSKLRGMFAICIYNDIDHTLIVARDRIGIKPLYYISNSNYFMFASEAKAFYSVRTIDPDLIDFKINRESLSLLTGFMFFPESGKTVVDPIKKLEPGHYAIVSETQGVVTNKYWILKENDDYKGISHNDAVEIVDKKLIESVEMHLLADVPLGVMLSGGVDSALITAIITKKLGIPATTFTAKFDHKFNESNLAKETSDYLGTTHHEIYIDTSEINKNIEQYAGLFDDLTTVDGGIITTSALCCQIRKNDIKVLLLGEGADEVFGGYSWFGLSQEPFRHFPRYFREAMYYYAISRNVDNHVLKYLNYWQQKTIPMSSTFNDISLKELSVQLPNHLLMKVDKGSMNQSIEARVPYLDHELVELVFSLASEFKISGKFYNQKKTNEKRLLRDVASKYLPPEIAYRKKKGFLLPMNDVLMANEDKVKSYILDSNSISRYLFTQNQLNTLFEKSGLEIVNMSREYLKWRLFIIETWSVFYKIR